LGPNPSRSDTKSGGLAAISAQNSPFFANFSRDAHAILVAICPDDPDEAISEVSSKRSSRRSDGGSVAGELNLCRNGAPFRI